MNNTDLKSALKVALEDMAAVPMTDDQVELMEVAAQEPVRPVSVAAAEIRRIDTLADQLDAVADKADALIVDGTASAVTADTLTMSVEHLLGQFNLELAVSSMESHGDDAGAHHKALAAQLRRQAEGFRGVSQEGMDASMEGFFTNVFGSEATKMEAAAKTLGEAKAALSASKAALNKEGVEINHAGVAKFLTINGQPTNNIADAIKGNNAQIDKLFKAAAQCGATLAKLTGLCKSAKLETDADVEAFIGKLLTLPSPIKLATPGTSGGQVLLGGRAFTYSESNGKLKKLEGAGEWAKGGEVIIDYKANTIQGKAGYLKKKGAGAVGAAAGAGVGVALGFAFGGPIGAAIVGTVGAVVGKAKAKSAVNQAAADKSQSSSTPVQALDGALTSVGALATSVAGKRTELSNFLDGFELFEDAKNELAGKIGAEVGKEARAKLKFVKGFADELYFVGGSAYECALEQSVYTVEGFASVIKKIVAKVK